jgi:uncharacterized membrane protein
LSRIGCDYLVSHLIPTNVFHLFGKIFILLRYILFVPFNIRKKHFDFKKSLKAIGSYLFTLFKFILAILTVYLFLMLLYFVRVELHKGMTIDGFNDAAMHNSGYEEKILR